MTGNPPYLLSEGFLHWLAKYLGDWSDGESKFRIARRTDGWLEAWRIGATEIAEVPVGVALRDAKKVSDPESPLGPYPIVVSEELMHTWLTPEDFERLRGGIHVSVGRKTIVESIEHRMRTLPPETVRALEARSWARGAREEEGIPESEESVVLELLRQYQTELHASRE